MPGAILYVAWGAALLAAFSTFVLAFLGIPGWGALVVVPVSAAAVGYGLRWGVAAAALALIIASRIGLGGAAWWVLAYALFAALVVGWAVRETLRRLIRRERRVKNSLSLFHKATDAVVEKEHEDEVLLALPHLLADYVDANVSVWLPDAKGFRRLSAVGLGDLDWVGERSVVGRTFASGRVTYVPDVSQDPDFVDGGSDQRAELALPIRARGRPRAVLDLGRKTPFHELEIESLKRFADVVGHHLSLLAEYAESRLLADLTHTVTSAQDLTQASREALVRLSSFFGTNGAALLRWRRGRYVPVAVQGDAQFLGGAETARGLAADGGLDWVYRTREPLFIPDCTEHPDVRPEWVEAGVRGLLLHPVRGGKRARVVLAMWSRAPRRWSEEEKEFLNVLTQVLGVMLQEFELKERLSLLLTLERNLPNMDEDLFYLKVLESAVDQIPGAEAGSLLVREDEAFVYRAVVGYDPAAVGRLRYGERTLAERCGEAWKAAEPRLLSQSAAGGMVAPPKPSASDAAPTGLERAVRHNLCIPIAYEGVPLALLNADAFGDEEAFDEESMQVAMEFAVQVSAMLHEASRRRLLERAALTDPLTGLGNRRAFEQQFATELARAQRQECSLTVVLCDLRRFKLVNDRYGHAAGDRALKRVAQLLRETLRSADLVYRWGGDEFAALLPCTDLEGALSSVRRLVAGMEPVRLKDVQLGINLGMAVFPDDGDDPETLLRVADERLYRAKSADRAYVLD
ncbi:diguanylate cyclase [Oceanithermus sp.]